LDLNLIIFLELLTGLSSNRGAAVDRDELLSRVSENAPILYIERGILLTSIKATLLKYSLVIDYGLDKKILLCIKKFILLVEESSLLNKVMWVRRIPSRGLYSKSLFKTEIYYRVNCTFDTYSTFSNISLRLSKSKFNLLDHKYMVGGSYLSLYPIYKKSSKQEITNRFSTSVILTASNSRFEVFEKLSEKFLKYLFLHTGGGLYSSRETFLGYCLGLEKKCSYKYKMLSLTNREVADSTKECIQYVESIFSDLNIRIDVPFKVLNASDKKFSNPSFLESVLEESFLLKGFRLYPTTSSIIALKEGGDPSEKGPTLFAQTENCSLETIRLGFKDASSGVREVRQRNAEEYFIRKVLYIVSRISYDNIILPHLINNDGIVDQSLFLKDGEESYLIS